MTSEYDILGTLKPLKKAVPRPEGCIKIGVNLSDQYSPVISAKEKADERKFLLGLCARVAYELTSKGK